MALELYVRKLKTKKGGRWEESGWHSLKDQRAVDIFEGLLTREDGCDFFAEPLYKTNYIVRVKLEDGINIFYKLYRRQAIKLGGKEDLIYETDKTLWNLIEGNVDFGDLRRYGPQDIIDAILTS